MLKRVLVAIIGVVAVVAGAFFALAYAAPAWDDFSNPTVSFSVALLGNMILWLIATTAMVLGIRFLRFAWASPQQ